MIEFDTLAVKLEDNWHIFVQPTGQPDTYSNKVMDGNASISDVLDKIKEMVHAAGSRNR